MLSVVFPNESHYFANAHYAFGLIWESYRAKGVDILKGPATWLSLNVMQAMRNPFFLHNTLTPEHCACVILLAMIVERVDRF